MTFLARGVWGSLPIVTMSGPDWTIFSTSRRILRRSTSRFFKTLAATPEPSFTSPSRMCSVPMYSWLKRCASWLASCITFRARSVKRSYIYAVSREGNEFVSPETRQTVSALAHHIPFAPLGREKWQGSAPRGDGGRRGGGLASRRRFDLDPCSVPRAEGGEEPAFGGRPGMNRVDEYRVCGI